MTTLAKYITRIEISSLWSGHKHIVWHMRPDVNVLSGGNGAGKSTILNRLIQHLRNVPTSGEIIEGMRLGVRIDFEPADATSIHYDIIRSFDRRLVNVEKLDQLTDGRVTTELDWQLYQLQRRYLDYQVNVAGPSTMAALLNSLQMGFKTLAIQKRSGEVWQLLGAVKTEFDKFGQGLTKMQQRLRQTDEELDNLIGVRSRAISRKLRAVQTIDESAAAALLELDAEPGKPVAARLPENGEEL